MEPADLGAARAFFEGNALALAVLDAVAECCERLDDVEVRVTRSQVAFWRRHGFAYLWSPGRYLARPSAEVVLSVAARHPIPSGRWKQVVEPATGRWTHHLEAHDADEIDDEVCGWLREAADDAR